MATIASRIGGSPGKEATAYAARSSSIRKASQAAFSVSGDHCDPFASTPPIVPHTPAHATNMSCYTDEMASQTGDKPYTSATGSSLAALARLPGSAAGVLALVPFLKARQGRRGAAHGLETSGWMTGFMLEVGDSFPSTYVFLYGCRTTTEHFRFGVVAANCLIYLFNRDCTRLLAK